MHFKNFFSNWQSKSSLHSSRSYSILSLYPKKKKSFSSLPYSKIQFFSIQTPGFVEIIPDSELFLMFTNGFTATFEFKGGTDIGAIGRMISEYVLEQA